MDRKGRVFTSADIKTVSASQFETTSSNGRLNAKMEITLENRSSYDLVVKTRLGVPMYVEAKADCHHSQHLFILISWSMTPQAIKWAIEDLERGNQAEYVTKRILESLDKSYPARCKSDDHQVSGVLKLEISVRDLIDNGGNAYIEDLDMTLCINDIKARSVTHPADRTLRVKKELQSTLPYIGKDTFIFGIKAVDNNPQRVYSDRYMRIGDDIQLIPTEKDPNLQTGIYVLKRPAAMGNPNDVYNHNLKPAYLSFEEADKLFGLADTVEKAVNGGDVAAAYKNQLAERAHERTILELARKEDMAKAEQELLLLKAAEARVKAAQEAAKEEAKSFIDWAKIVGGVVTGLATLVGVFMKLKPA